MAPALTWINIRPLLHKTNQLIEKGEKWRFGVEMVGKECPVGEALKITLGEIREKARDVKKKSKAKPKSPTAVKATKEEPAADVWRRHLGKSEMAGRTETSQKGTPSGLFYSWSIRTLPTYWHPRWRSYKIEG